MKKISVVSVGRFEPHVSRMDCLSSNLLMSLQTEMRRKTPVSPETPPESRQASSWFIRKEYCDVEVMVSLGLKLELDIGLNTNESTGADATEVLKYNRQLRMRFNMLPLGGAHSQGNHSETEKMNQHKSTS